MSTLPPLSRLAIAATSPSTFELWLKSLPLQLRCHIFNLVPAHDLCQLERTSKTVRECVVSYRCFAWDFARFLTPWGIQPLVFLAKMDMTGAISSGIQALRFLKRLKPCTTIPLRVFVRIGGAIALGRHLLASDYHLPDVDISTELYTFEEAVLVMAAQMAVRPDPINEDLISIFTFTKTTLTLPAETYTIELVITTGDPVQFVVACTGCTANLNIITPFQSISLYPRSTFITNNSYVCKTRCGDSRKEADALHAHFSTSFNVIETGSIDESSIYGRRVRHVGDHNSWVMPTTGKYHLLLESHKRSKRLSALGNPEVPSFQTSHSGNMLFLNLEFRSLFRTGLLLYRLGPFRGPCQTLRGREARKGTPVVIKRITTTSADPDDLGQDVQSLRHISDSMQVLYFLQFLQTFQNEVDTFFVFADEGITLREVATSAEIAEFSHRQVNEIILQLMNGIDYLHDEDIVHGDLCPSNILFLSSDTTTESWYSNETEEFYDQKVLRSTQLRICFFGTVARESTVTGHDRYRAPEAVIELPLTIKADYFSLGLVMVEIMCDKPFLCDCTTSDFYVRDKFYVMENLLGDIPDDFGRIVQDKYANVLTPWFTVDTGGLRPVEPSVEDFVTENETLDNLVSDRNALRVIRNLLQYSPEDRDPLWLMRNSYSYFSAEWI
ncbi:kinase-like domain-containing protein [Coprinopsis sp. MPI-PUGE-AT-0042]|nr:kinase-like domain-containing protein [Coprinopsis sp. MPI-PUGE-AT-0042]